jgi:hypothetical protein
LILPQKHIKLSESIFGFGGFLLQLLHNPISVDELWEEHIRYNTSMGFPSFRSFDDFIITLDYLYIIGAIRQDERGLINCEIN